MDVTPYLLKEYDCPVCGEHKNGYEYAPGLKKCLDCVDMIKQLRRDEGRMVSCLSLFYGSVSIMDRIEELI